MTERVFLCPETDHLNLQCKDEKNIFRQTRGNGLESGK